MVGASYKNYSAIKQLKNNSVYPNVMQDFKNSKYFRKIMSLIVYNKKKKMENSVALIFQKANNGLTWRIGIQITREWVHGTEPSPLVLLWNTYLFQR